MTWIAVGFCVAGGLIGGLIGAALGNFTPDLYRAWFPPDPHLDAPPYNPAQLGIGLGIIQGLVGGLLLGCVVLVATAIRSRKTLNA